MHFSDQVDLLATWFKSWNECEQTVALYSLLKRVKKCQAKFLSRCLETILTDCDDLMSLERDANSAEYLAWLSSVPNKSEVISNLLTHLPLLRPGNHTVKNLYLDILPRVLGYAIERSEFLEESRQLLSYSLIHPAFDNKERNLLTAWMSGLDGKPSSDGGRMSSSPGEVSPESSSATNSLETGVSLSDWNHNKVSEEQTSSSPNARILKEFPNDYGSEPCLSATSSLSLEKSTLSLSSASASSEVLADGMADVKSWLKSLRLHKYAELFSQMNYEEMMSLSAEHLDAKNVTQGARKKILLSIKKLHERFSQLQALENEILGGGSLRAALNELKSIIQTPIKRFDSSSSDQDGGAIRKEVIEDGDIPSMFTKVMGKACTQVLVSKPDEDNITLYLKLLERCLQHPAFTEANKRRLRPWKQQVHKLYRSLPRNSRPQSRSQPNVGYPGMRRPISRSHFPSQHLSSAPRPLNPLSPPPMRAMFPPHNQHMNWFTNANSLSNPTPPPVLDATRKTASLDPRLGQRMFEDPEDDLPTSEINTQLNSLSMSVVDYALGDTLDGAQTL